MSKLAELKQQLEIAQEGLAEAETYGAREHFQHRCWEIYEQIQEQIQEIENEQAEVEQ